MKKSITKSVVLILGGCLLISTKVFAETNSTGVIKTAGAALEQDSIKSRIEKRLNELEQLGEVPENADSLDWELAQRTSWWGKPLDPKEFWKGRVVWLDASARLAARGHGRQLPPMPFDDLALSQRSNEDMVFSSGLEGPVENIHMTDRENAFWDHFNKTHPKPPEDLDRKEWEVASGVFESRTLVGISPEAIKKLQESIKRDAMQTNYPEEGFTDEALFWTYVLQQRREWEKLANDGRKTNSIPTQSFMRRFARSGVDFKYISDPLTDEQVQAANIWKITYLQRLRNEKVDTSYINAYLKAWNLSGQEIFK